MNIAFMPRVNICGGSLSAPQSPDKTAAPLDNRSTFEGALEKAAAKVAEGSYGLNESRESRSQRKYDAFSLGTEMKKQAAFAIEQSIDGCAGRSGGSDDMILSSKRAMSAAAALTAGREVSREDVRELIGADPALYILSIAAAKRNEITEITEESKTADVLDESEEMSSPEETADIAAELNDTAEQISE